MTNLHSPEEPFHDGAFVGAGVLHQKAADHVKVHVAEYVDLLQLLFLELLVGHLKLADFVDAVEIHLGVQVGRSLPALRIEELVN